MTSEPLFPAEREPTDGRDQARQRAWTETKALLWIRGRELMGDSRNPGKLLAAGWGFITWLLMCVAAVRYGVRSGDIDLADTLPFVAGAAWPLWALLPMLGNGAGEVIPVHRLAPYPVSHQGVFFSAWVTALIDIPNLLIVPVLAALAVVGASPVMLIAVAAFLLGGTAVGQVLAWGASKLFVGRRATVAKFVAAAAGVFIVVLVATGHVDELIRVARVAASILPSGWLLVANEAAMTGDWVMFNAMVVLLAAPVPVAVLWGPRLARSAAAQLTRGNERRASRPSGSPTWAAKGSTFRLLVATAARSSLRAVTTRASMMSLAMVPLVGMLPESSRPPSVEGIGAVAGVAACTSLLVNAFSFDSGGLFLLWSMPVRRWMVVTAKAAVGIVILTGVQLLAVALSASALNATWDSIWLEIYTIPARSMLMAGVATYLSVRYPSSADHDSLRTRGAQPKAILTFLLVVAVLLSFQAHIADELNGLAGAVTALGIGAGTLIVFLTAAVTALHRGRAEKVAINVLQVG